MPWKNASPQTKHFIETIGRWQVFAFLFMVPAEGARGDAQSFYLPGKFWDSAYWIILGGVGQGGNQKNRWPDLFWRSGELFEDWVVNLSVWVAVFCLVFCGIISIFRCFRKDETRKVRISLEFEPIGIQKFEKSACWLCLALSMYFTTLPLCVFFHPDFPQKVASSSQNIPKLPNVHLGCKAYIGFLCLGYLTALASFLCLIWDAKRCAAGRCLLQNLQVSSPSSSSPWICGPSVPVARCSPSWPRPGRATLFFSVRPFFFCPSLVYNLCPVGFSNFKFVFRKN